MYNKLKDKLKLPQLDLGKLNLKAGLIGLVVLLLVGLGYGGFQVYQESVKIIPEELLAEALDKTLALNSYSYSVSLTMTVNGQERRLTDIAGIKANGGDFHIQGEMYETKVEIFQFADSTYQRDPISGKWMVFPTSVTDMELMVTEINPLSNFNFKHLNEISYQGIEKMDGRKVYVLKCKPQINNQFLELYWENFEYTLWVDKASRYIIQATITATNIKTPENTLSLNISLDNFNKEFKLEKPI